MSSTGTPEVGDGESEDTHSPPPSGVSRRQVLVLAGVVGVGGIVTAVALAGRSSALPADLAANLAQLPGSEQLRRIGDAVLATDSVERDVTALCAAVAPSGIDDPVAWCTDTAPASITEHVHDASSGDFVSGEVLVVEGWRLSRTEAALAALVALS